jgi:hypothetical protein
VIPNLRQFLVVVLVPSHITDFLPAIAVIVAVPAHLDQNIFASSLAKSSPSHLKLFHFQHFQPGAVTRCVPSRYHPHLWVHPIVNFLPVQRRCPHFLLH